MSELERFLSRGPSRQCYTAWITHGVVRVYLRRFFRHIEGEVREVIDLANVEVNRHKRGQGVFTAFLDELEAKLPVEWLYIENAHDGRFSEFFLRKGFTRDTRYEEPCFYKKIAPVKQNGVV
jgi:hypothetical protein